MFLRWLKSYFWLHKDMLRCRNYISIFSLISLVQCWMMDLPEHYKSNRECNFRQSELFLTRVQLYYNESLKDQLISMFWNATTDVVLFTKKIVKLVISSFFYLWLLRPIFPANLSGYCAKRLLFSRLLWHLCKVFLSLVTGPIVSKSLPMCIDLFKKTFGKKVMFTSSKI